eukprot:TRINITY_DN18701_c0_g1_i1.p1 TRINITY_DN18701_c0_g1~~TRINITY_DN18701_c0_g1_i1.p1  ORF type:complete len:113 (-),score=13.39 TRINITY_DN18701_c0_g1_i1:259-597(-)
MNVLHSVSVAEFDLDIGNSLIATCPSDIDYKQELNCSRVDDLCFPDGAHSFDSDAVFMIVPSRRSNELLFGLAAFARRKSESYARGAVMASLLVLTRRPLFFCIIRLRCECC